jgi:hypothetical protein
MMQTLLAAGTRLAELLRAENEALTALDMKAAAAIAPLKAQAAEAFAAAYAVATRTGSKAEGPQRAAIETLAERLRRLSEDNKRLLERGIALQARVIETIARAALPTAAPPTYGAAGYRAMPRMPSAMALSARV